MISSTPYQRVHKIIDKTILTEAIPSTNMPLHMHIKESFIEIAIFSRKKSVKKQLHQERRLSRKESVKKQSRNRIKKGDCQEANHIKKSAHNKESYMLQTKSRRSRNSHWDNYAYGFLLRLRIGLSVSLRLTLTPTVFLDVT